MPLLARFWFLGALGMAALLGNLLPSAGAALRGAVPHPVAAAMLLSGFAIRPRNLLRESRDLRGLAIAFGSVYVAAPVLGWLLALLLAPAASATEFRQGVMVLAAQAGTIASAIALTVMAGGNHELALLNTLLTNFATAVLTPLILRIGAQAEVRLDYLGMLSGMALTVLAPVAAGILLRAGAARIGREPGKPLLRSLRVLSQLIILIFVLVGFSRAAPEIARRPEAGLRILGVAALLHAGLLGLTAGLGRLARLDRASRAAVIFTGSQKTLPNGIYIAETFFPQNPYAALPVVLHHVLQLLVDTVLVRWLSARTREG